MYASTLLRSDSRASTKNRSAAYVLTPTFESPGYLRRYHTHAKAHGNTQACHRHVQRVGARRLAGRVGAVGKRESRQASDQFACRFHEATLPKPTHLHNHPMGSKTGAQM